MSLKASSDRKDAIHSDSRIGLRYLKQTDRVEPFSSYLTVNNYRSRF